MFYSHAARSSPPFFNRTKGDEPMLLTTSDVRTATATTATEA
jgi:hypothetical protein